MFCFFLADEIYDIAMVFLKDENFYQALKYLMKSRELYLAEGLTENAIFALDNIAYVMHEVSYKIIYQITPKDNISLEQVPAINIIRL